MMIQFLLSTPLEARQDFNYIIPILIGIFVLIFVIGTSFVIALINKKRKKIQEDPNRKTTKADIEFVSKKINLSQKESDFLAYLCKKNDVKNLSFLIKDEEAINKIFQNERENFTNYDDEMKDAFFSLMQKFYYYYSFENTITSTKNLEEGTAITFLNAGKAYSTKVLKITTEGILTDIPKNIDNEELNIKNMTKIIMKFSSKSSHIGYKVEVRFLRYEVTNDGNKFLVAHNNNIQTIHRRRERRIPYSLDCDFRAATIKDKKISISEKVHKGKFENISPHGCCIITNLPIKERQHIYIEFTFSDGTPGKFLGIIKHREFSKNEDIFKFHIMIEKIDLKIKNKISEMYF